LLKQVLPGVEKGFAGSPELLSREGYEYNYWRGADSLLHALERYKEDLDPSPWKQEETKNMDGHQNLSKVEEELVIEACKLRFKEDRGRSPWDNGRATKQSALDGLRERHRHQLNMPTPGKIGHGSKPVEV
jgi:hypothetical protein